MKAANRSSTRGLYSRTSSAHCQGVISGVAIEIEPHVPPLAAFGSYWKAKHRVFMSATVTDDAFLV